MMDLKVCRIPDSQNRSKSCGFLSLDSIYWYLAFIRILKSNFGPFQSLRSLNSSVHGWTSGACECPEIISVFLDVCFYV